MSIEIKIIDPAFTSNEELQALIVFLQHFVGDTLTVRDANLSKHVHTHKDLAAQTGAPIAPDDSPAAGVDASEVFAGGGNPAEVFAGGANPAEVFAGNAPAAPLPTASNSVGVAAPASNTSLAPVLNGVELDTRGLPWDARIHAETKSKIKAGTWKNKRGVDDATIAAVEAELRTVLGVAAPNPMAHFKTAAELGMITAPNPPIAPAIPAPPGVTTLIAPISAAPSVPVAPPPPVDIAQPVPLAVTAAAVPSAPAITFPQLCARITGGLGNQTLTQETLAAVLGKYGLQGLPTLASFPNLVGPVAADLGFA